MESEHNHPGSDSRLKRGSEVVTLGIRVRVEPMFLEEQSEPEESQFVFAYMVHIENEGERLVQLLSRHWLIIDANGHSREVEGEGVIGRQPTIAPGASFEYSSFCPLATPWGTMEGHYTMRAHEEEAFDVEIGRFYLVADPATTPVLG